MTPPASIGPPIHGLLLLLLFLISTMAVHYDKDNIKRNPQNTSNSNSNSNNLYPNEIFENKYNHLINYMNNDNNDVQNKINHKLKIFLKGQKEFQVKYENDNTLRKIQKRHNSTVLDQKQTVNETVERRPVFANNTRSKKLMSASKIIEYLPKTPAVTMPDDGASLPKKRTKVSLLGLFELSTKYGDRPEGRSELAAAKLAVKHINAKKLLPGYTLELHVNDTQVYGTRFKI